jgi:hypothetical protein
MDDAGRIQEADCGAEEKQISRQAPVVDGIEFDSAAEANRYQDLLTLISHTREVHRG